MLPMPSPRRLIKLTLSRDIIGRCGWWLAIAVGVGGIDWWLKSQLAFQLNTGASFSFFSQQSWLVILGSITVLLLVLIIPVKMWQQRPVWPKHWSWLWWGSQALVVGGALSNLVDRLLYGGVRDYWLIPLTPIRNNLADWGIVGGLAAMVLVWWMGQARLSSAKPKASGSRCEYRK